MNLNPSTLRPGLLVSLKTTISGNVDYQRNVIESEHVESDGSLQAAWETRKRITDPKEHERAIKTRGKCRSVITGICAQSSFGLLCPENQESQLEAAIAEARRIAAEFNETATLSRIGVYVITGRVARDDVEAVRAINSEVRQLLSDMQAGVKSLDVKKIRDAANKARQLGNMLTPEADARIKAAIEAARKTARRINKAGEVAGGEVDRDTISRIEAQRTAFLDLDDGDDVATPTFEGRAVDFEPHNQPETAKTDADDTQDQPDTESSQQAPEAVQGDFDAIEPVAPPPVSRPAFDLD